MRIGGPSCAMLRTHSLRTASRGGRERRAWRRPTTHCNAKIGASTWRELRMAVNARRKTVVADIGGVKTGGTHPIVVQSMTNTDTADVASTVNQVMALARSGSELVRVTVNTEAAAAAVPKIVDTCAQFGVRVPIIGDFHYNGHILLKKYPDCARALAKYRINPGNVNIGRKHDDNFRTMIEAAIEYQKSVRIGVNWGSLDRSILTRLMDENARRSDPKDT